MASTMLRGMALLLLAVVSPWTTRAASAAGACAGEKFPPGKTFASCQDLPQLGAALHWTYDEAKSSLSVAFVAAPAGPGGWVAWGLNPTGEGMIGTQALVALKGAGAATAPLAVKTYNITAYAPLGKKSTPLEFPATELSADAGKDGKIRMFGTLQLHKGMKEVNQVWQVGSSVTDEAPDKHAMGPANMGAKAKLALAGGPAASAAPAAPEGGASNSAGGDGAKPASAATVAGVSAPALLVLALVGVLLML